MSWPMLRESGPAKIWTRDLSVASPKPYRSATTQHNAELVHRTSQRRLQAPVTSSLVFLRDGSAIHHNIQYVKWTQDAQNTALTRVYR